MTLVLEAGIFIIFFMIGAILAQFLICYLIDRI